MIKKELPLSMLHDSRVTLAPLASPAGTVELSPSILSADFAQLRDAVLDIQDAGCRWVHCDVMDNHFVPNLTFGAPVVKALAKSVPDMFYDVHLMIDKPEESIAEFIRAGSHAVTFHVEACADPAAAVASIHEAGVFAGLSIKPATPVRALLPYLSAIDMVLVMTVEPGFGGQGMIADCIDKIRELARLRAENGWSFAIEVDGGINAQTVATVVSAGAEILVAGSAIYNANPVKTNIRAFDDALAPLKTTIHFHPSN